MESFLIIGNANCIADKNIFNLIKRNKMWCGVNLLSGTMPYFIVPKEFVSTKDRVIIKDDGTILKQVNSIAWFTNITHQKRKEFINLTKTYSKENYPKYDNYDAIEIGHYKDNGEWVASVYDIPIDYNGIMGVPITFLSKYNPNQFEIIGWSRHNNMNMDGGCWLGGKVDATINGKDVYRRILIRKKQI